MSPTLLVLRVSILTHMERSAVVNDMLQGQIITSIVIVAFVFGFLLREWVLMNGPIAPAPPRQELDPDPLEVEAMQRFVANALETLALPPAIEEPVGGYDGDRPHEAEEDVHWLHAVDEGGEEEMWGDEIEEAPFAGARGRAYLQDHNQASSDDEQDRGVGSSAGASRESPRRRRKDKARQDDRTQRRIARRARAAERDVRPLPRNAASPSSSSSQSSAAANPSLDEEDRDRDQRWQAYHENEGQGDDDDDWDDVPALEVWPGEPIAGRDPNEVVVIDVRPLGEREDDFQDVFDDLEGIMEAIGMRGSLLVLVQNMGESSSVKVSDLPDPSPLGLMNLLVGLCLGGGVWIPLCIGRALAAGNAVRGLLQPLRAVRSISDPVFDALWTTLTFLPRITLSYIATYIAPLCSSLSSSSLSKACATLFPSIATSPVPITLATASTESTRPLVISTTKYLLASIAQHWVEMGIAEDPLHRTLCVILGYVAILTVGSWYLHFARDEYGLSLGKIVRDTGTQFKVCLFIFIEVSPMVSRFVVRVSLTMDPRPRSSCSPPCVVSSSTSQLCRSSRTLPSLLAWLPTGRAPSLHSVGRISFSRARVGTDDPAVLTWLGGTICMFSLSLGIDTIRGIVRSGFLWFIRDPAAQEFHPIREILQRDSRTQAKKIAISGLLYTGTIFATFGINILFLRYACGILPLRWSAE